MPPEISVAEAAQRLSCSTGVLYHWINTGQLAARRGSGTRFCIPWNDETDGRLPGPGSGSPPIWAGPPDPREPPPRHPRR